MSAIRPKDLKFLNYGDQILLSVQAEDEQYYLSLARTLNDDLDLMPLEDVYAYNFRYSIFEIDCPKNSGGRKMPVKGDAVCTTSKFRLREVLSGGHLAFNEKYGSVEFQYQEDIGSTEFQFELNINQKDSGRVEVGNLKYAFLKADTGEYLGVQETTSAQGCQSLLPIRSGVRGASRWFIQQYVDSSLTSNSVLHGGAMIRIEHVLSGLYLSNEGPIVSLRSKLLSSSNYPSGSLWQILKSSSRVASDILGAVSAGLPCAEESSVYLLNVRSQRYLQVTGGSMGMCKSVDEASEFELYHGDPTVLMANQYRGLTEQQDQGFILPCLMSIKHKTHWVQIPSESNGAVGVRVRLPEGNSANLVDECLFRFESPQDLDLKGWGVMYFGHTMAQLAQGIPLAPRPLRRTLKNIVKAMQKDPQLEVLIQDWFNDDSDIYFDSLLRILIPDPILKDGAEVGEIISSLNGEANIREFRAAVKSFVKEEGRQKVLYWGYALLNRILGGERNRFALMEKHPNIPLLIISSLGHDVFAADVLTTLFTNNVRASEYLRESCVDGDRNGPLDILIQVMNDLDSSKVARYYRLLTAMVVCGDQVIPNLRIYVFNKMYGDSDRSRLLPVVRFNGDDQGKEEGGELILYWKGEYVETEAVDDRVIFGLKLLEVLCRSCLDIEIVRKSRSLLQWETLHTLKKGQSPLSKQLAETIKTVYLDNILYDTHVHILPQLDGRTLQRGKAIVYQKHAGKSDKERVEDLLQFSLGGPESKLEGQELELKSLISDGIFDLLKVSDSPGLLLSLLAPLLASKVVPLEKISESAFRASEACLKQAIVSTKGLVAKKRWMEQFDLDHFLEADILRCCEYLQLLQDVRILSRVQFIVDKRSNEELLESFKKSEYEEDFFGVHTTSRSGAGSDRSPQTLEPPLMISFLGRKDISPKNVNTIISTFFRVYLPHWHFERTFKEHFPVEPVLKCPEGADKDVRCVRQLDIFTKDVHYLALLELDSPWVALLNQNLAHLSSREGDSIDFLCEHTSLIESLTCLVDMLVHSDSSVTKRAENNCDEASSSGNGPLRQSLVKILRWVLQAKRGNMESKGSLLLNLLSVISHDKGTLPGWWRTLLREAIEGAVHGPERLLLTLFREKNLVPLLLDLCIQNGAVVFDIMPLIFQFGKSLSRHQRRRLDADVADWINGLTDEHQQQLQSNSDFKEMLRQSAQTFTIRLRKEKLKNWTAILGVFKEKPQKKMKDVLDSAHQLANRIPVGPVNQKSNSSDNLDKIGQALRKAASENSRTLVNALFCGSWAEHFHFLVTCHHILVPTNQHLLYALVLELLRKEDGENKYTNLTYQDKQNFVISAWRKPVDNLGEGFFRAEKSNIPHFIGILNNMLAGGNGDAQQLLYNSVFANQQSLHSFRELMKETITNQSHTLLRSMLDLIQQLCEGQHRPWQSELTSMTELIATHGLDTENATVVIVKSCHVLSEMCQGGCRENQMSLLENGILSIFTTEVLCGFKNRSMLDFSAVCMAYFELVLSLLEGIYTDSRLRKQVQRNLGSDFWELSDCEVYKMLESRLENSECFLDEERGKEFAKNLRSSMTGMMFQTSGSEVEPLSGRDICEYLSFLYCSVQLILKDVNVIKEPSKHDHVKIASVEVMYGGALCKQYFPKPRLVEIGYIGSDVKKAMMHIQGDNITDKLEALQQRISMWHYEMRAPIDRVPNFLRPVLRSKNRKALSGAVLVLNIWLNVYMVSFNDELDAAFLIPCLFSLLAQILLTMIEIILRASPRKDEKTSRALEWQEDIRKTAQSISRKASSNKIHPAPNDPTASIRTAILEQMYNAADKRKGIMKTWIRTMAKHKIRLTVLIATLLALCSHPFYVSVALFELLLVLQGAGGLHTVLMAIKESFWSLLSIGVLTALITYILTLYVTVWFKDEYNNLGDTTCDTIHECFVALGNQGIRSGWQTGLSDFDVDSDWKFYHRALFDMLYFWIVVVIMMNLVMGVIVDKFGELRQERDAIKRSLSERCFVCNLHSDILSRHALDASDVFRIHCTKEHNVWDYFCFLIYLKERDRTQMTGVEKHVFDCWQMGDVSYFPINMALRVLQGESNSEGEWKQGISDQMSRIEKLLAVNSKKKAVSFF